MEQMEEKRFQDEGSSNYIGFQEDNIEEQE
jgi:hypothetical protein